MWKKVLGGFILLIVLAVGLAFYLTAGMTKTAETFFKEVAAKQYDQAYALTSADFKKVVSKEQMIAFLKQNGLDSFQSASWGNRSAEGNRGVIEGSIITSAGAIPLTIKMVKAGDSWQIYSIDKPAAGTQIEKEVKNPGDTAGRPAEATQASAQPASPKPAESAVQDTDAAYTKLVKETLHTFALSINQKNMEGFRQSVSKALQDAVSTEKFNNAFKVFIEKNVDFTIVDPMQPVFDSKPVINDGILTLKGHYDTTPNKLYFNLSYMQENGAWKLTNIDVNVK